MPVIKKLSLSELPESAETIRESFGTVAVEFGLTRGNCPTNGAFTQTEHLEEDFQKGCLMYGLYVNGEQAGFVELRHKGGEIFELTKLAVRPAHRHQGYGEKLLQCARKAVLEKGGKKITMGIIEQNTVLKDWYLKQGFIHTGTKQFPQLPFLVGFMEQSL